MAPMGANSSPRFRLAFARSKFALLLFSVATAAWRLAVWVLTSSIACWSMNRLARAAATSARTRALAASRSASADTTAAFLIATWIS